MGKGLTYVRRLAFWASASFLLLATSCLMAPAVAADVPPGALAYAPVLASVQARVWVEAPEPWTLAGQVEQESCISLKHPRCWNPRAELKTSREYGFGFGQLTVAYREDGSVRFNKFDEVRAAYPSLKDWSWAERYRADYQLQALVELDRTLWSRSSWASSRPKERWAFTLAAYNGGMSGTLQDRLLCERTAGCDPAVWFENVEKTSLKTRRVNPGYGKSAFEINREYPRLVLTTRRAKYEQFWSLK